MSSDAQGFDTHQQQIEQEKLDKATASSTTTDPFARIEKSLNAPTNSPFLKIAANTSVVLKFDANKIREVERTFENDGEERTVRRMECTVQTEDGQEKTIDFAFGWVRQLLPLLKEGFTWFRVERKGERMETNYTFVPLVNRS